MEALPVPVVLRLNRGGRKSSRAICNCSRCAAAPRASRLIIYRAAGVLCLALKDEGAGFTGKRELSNWIWKVPRGFSSADGYNQILSMGILGNRRKRVWSGWILYNSYGEILDKRYLRQERPIPSQRKHSNAREKFYWMIGNRPVLERLFIPLDGWLILVEVYECGDPFGPPVCLSLVPDIDSKPVWAALMSILPPTSITIIGVIDLNLVGALLMGILTPWIRHKQRDHICLNTMSILWTARCLFGILKTNVVLWYFYLYLYLAPTCS